MQERKISMPIKLDLANRIPESALIIDSSLVGEVIDVDPQYVTLKVYFSVRLNDKSYNPLLYKKVNISILTDAQRNSLTTPFKNNNFEDNNSFIKKNILGKNTVAQIGTDESKLSQDLSFNKRFLSNENISLESQIKYNKYRTIVQSVKNTIGDNSTITSQTVYIDQKVVSALKTAVDFTDIILPDFINISQDKSLLTERVSNSSDLKIFQDIVNSKTTISKLISKSTQTAVDDTQNLNEKLIIDYLIHSANKLDRRNLSNLNYYTKQRSRKFLNKLDLSTEFKLRRSYTNKSLTLKFDLFSKDSPDNPGLTRLINLDFTRFFDVYYKSIKSINIDCTSRQLNALVNENTLSFSCQQEDEKKILSYNLYVKNLLSQDNSKFSFLTSLEKNSSYVSQQANDSYSLCYRVKPVTYFGESYVFSDCVVKSVKGEKTLFEADNFTFFNVRQISSNSVELEISYDNENISNQIRKIKIYKRNCTLSSDAPFGIFSIEYLSDSSSSKQVLNDENILVNNFYEYYVELIDQYENVIKSSEPKLINVRFINDPASFSVSVSNVSITPDTVLFSIQTDIQKLDTSANLLKQQLDKLRINVTPTQEVSSNPNDYPITAYHKITRIDTVTNKRETFSLVTDGTFEDSPETRKRMSISDPITGRSYKYMIESFKRDPVTITKDFLVVGNTNIENKTWFYRPSKWMHPRVLNTGTLLEENENSFNESHEETFMSDFIGTFMVNDINFSINRRDLQISNVAATRASLTNIKISWNLMQNLIDQFDSFIVCKVVNGKKSILGITSEPYLYHALDNEEDLGTLFYEVTPVSNDYVILQTHMSNPLIITQNLEGKF